MPDSISKPETSDPASGQGVMYPGIGFQIAEYEITGTLGQGSMATVYLARDRAGNEVALKIFQEGSGVSKTMLERFQREADATKKLRKHPNIITVYTTGKEGPHHYIAMQVVEGGGTLGEWMESSTVPPKALIKMLLKIARALDYAHARRIIHRDVKPANIMIDEFGEPLLTDFGVAAMTDLPSFTMSGALTGTPLYMSPEQAAGEATGPATDIYSLGVVLYEVMTGSLPHGCERGTPVKEVLRSIREDAPKRPRYYRRDIPADLEAVILKCLERKPEDRYLDAESVASDLRRFLQHRPVMAHHFGVLDRIRLWARAYKMPIITILIAGVVAAGVRTYFLEKYRLSAAQGLLNYARLISAGIEHSGDAAAKGVSRETRQVWNDIRLGRNAMIGGDWQQASRIFQAAVNFCLETGDERTMGVARLEQARCEILLENRRLAMDLYRWVIGNTDVSLATRDQAQLEFLQLALLSNDRDQSLKVLLWKRPPDDGPVRDAIDCLTGDLSAEDLSLRIRLYPSSFQNDAAFTAALRKYLDQDFRNAEKLFNRAVRLGSPSTDWPNPWIRKVYRQIQLEKRS